MRGFMPPINPSIASQMRNIEIWIQEGEIVNRWCYNFYAKHPTRNCSRKNVPFSYLNSVSILTNTNTLIIKNSLSRWIDLKNKRERSFLDSNFLQNSRVITKLLRSVLLQREKQRGRRGERERSGQRAYILRLDADDAATIEEPSCRVLMSTTRDIVRRFKLSISDPTTPCLALGWGCITRYTCCRFWLLSTDVTDLPRSPRDTNLSIHPPREGRRLDIIAGYSALFDDKTYPMQIWSVKVSSKNLFSSIRSWSSIR